MTEQFEQRVTYEEIARALRASPGTIRKRISCAHILAFDHPTDRRKSHVRLADLPPDLQSRINRERVARAIEEVAAPPDPNKQPLVDVSAIRTKTAAKATRAPQSSFHFEPLSSKQEAIDDAVAAVPEARRAWVER